MLRVRINWTGPTVVGGGLSTHYFTGDDTQTGANNAAAALNTFWDAICLQLGNATAWSLDPIVAVLDVNGEQTGQFTVAAQSGAGALTATYEAIATNGLIQWRTGAFVGGRQIRGRTFITGITQANVSGGAPHSNIITAVNNASAALVADANTTLAVWSKKNALTASVSSGTMWTKYAVLRSRRD